MSEERSTTHGAFVVLEGTDGSGKGTQFKLLADTLRADGYDVEVFDFPRYDHAASYFVQEYLNGHYGSVDQIGPYTASLFYALDRFDAAEKIHEALESGKVVLANRFTGSNMAHQGAKFRDDHERRGYFIWLDNLEFEMLKIPRPDRNIVLRVPAETAQQLVDKKGLRSYTDRQRDIHEADLSHLRRSVEVYDDLCQLFPKDFSRIDCVRGGQLLSIEDIAKLVLETVRPLLPKRQRRRHAEVRTKPADSIAEAVTPPKANGSKKQSGKHHVNGQRSDDNPYLERQPDGAYVITDTGRQWLEKAVTNINSPVYATTTRLESLTAAAAMTRMSRRGDNLQITLLEEFAGGMDAVHETSERAASEYGDVSVGQLVGQHLIVEGASQILTHTLESGRLASYAEQSARFIHYDHKDADGKYLYVIPEGLDKRVRQAYVVSMDVLFRNYSNLVRQLTEHIRQHSGTPANERDTVWKSATRAVACDAIRPVLPVATKSTVGIFASGQALEDLIMRLLADELPEARLTGQRILDEARKVIPAYLKHVDQPSSGGATVAYLANTRHDVRTLANDHLSSNHTDAVRSGAALVHVSPRNEFDLVPEMLYEHSHLPLSDLRTTVATWPYERKRSIFEAYIGERLDRRHRPGRALENARYSWDIVCDYGVFRDLQRHRMVDDLQWQELTPRYGYEIPKLVEDAGLSDLFEECFDLSLRLYSIMQQHGYQLEAQYATLLGHRMRWKVTYNAREAFHIHELHTSPHSHPAHRKLVGQMHESLRERHPMLAEAMRFVNQDEDPELARLAAERYTQYKLSVLDKGTSQ